MADKTNKYIPIYCARETPRLCHPVETDLFYPTGNTSSTVDIDFDQFNEFLLNVLSLDELLSKINSNISYFNLPLYFNEHVSVDLPMYHNYSVTKPYTNVFCDFLSTNCCTHHPVLNYRPPPHGGTIHVLGQKVPNPHHQPPQKNSLLTGHFYRSPYYGETIHTIGDNTSNSNNIRSFMDQNKESFLTGTNLGPVINLSNFQLTPPMIELLSKGLNFCPTPGEPERLHLRQDLDKFHVSLRRKLIFSKIDDSAQLDLNIQSTLDEQLSSNEGLPFDNYQFRNPSTWNPTAPFQLETFITLNESRLNEYHFPSDPPSNLIHRERSALTELTKAKDIIIKAADKGSAVVIQDLDDYIQEGLRQLSDPNFYRETPYDFTELHQGLINNLVDFLESTGEISKKCSAYLRVQNPRTPQLYLLPKIHKRKIPMPGRPIVSANNSPTERISELADFFLKPLVHTTRSYIRDTTDFINKIEQLPTLTGENYLCTIDVTSLYTNIPNDEGIKACEKLLDQLRTDGNPPSNTSITRLLEHVLYLNNFDFNDKHYLQVGGTAMGTRVAPSFANIFMADFEQTWVYTYHTQPLCWFRYIDDIFMVWNKNKESLTDFLTYLNTCHHSIKFTSEVSTEKITFLDTTVRPNADKKLYTDLYCKPTDSHNYLLYSSSHPKHLTRSLPYSQLLRIRRICHYIEDFDTNAALIGQNFLRRGYPEDLVFESMIRARRTDRATLLLPKQNEEEKNWDNSFLVTTFNPSCTPLKDIVQSSWNLLGRTAITDQVFHTTPIYGYRRNKNLKDILVRAKISHTETTPDTKEIRSKNRKCIAKKCRYCPRLDPTGNVQNSTTARTYPTRTKVTCNSNNLIYCIKCNQCSKLYVGQTKNSIKERFKCHFYSITKPKSSDTTVGRHFSRPDHAGIDDVTILVLDFITSPQNTPSGQRLRDEKEKLWIHRLSTIAPLGLNSAD